MHVDSVPNQSMHANMEMSQCPRGRVMLSVWQHASRPCSALLETLPEPTKRFAHLPCHRACNVPMPVGTVL